MVYTDNSDSQRADRILASLPREESQPGRGVLKIFFGMAPGVGKTYAMLEAAIQAAEKGTNVLIGVAEAHGRVDTQRLIDRLPKLPLAQVSYRGVQLQEFDLEEALRIKPRLIVVDELAHTNAPGLRHKKRYQDVQDLLAAGIDVYSTLNVQHLESRSDTVQDITTAPVQETVPDSILAEADSIQLVDIAPAQLRTRLQEGKVYREPQAITALENFFKESNLTALRELSLRVMAEKVDHDLSESRTVAGDLSVWRTSNRLMVAVGPSPYSARLVRWTCRMAYALNAPWIALSVDTGAVLAPEAQQRLDSHLELARRMGAEVMVIAGNDLAETLLHIGFLRNVTQIVVGKPQQSYLWGMVRPVSLVDKLIKGSGEIDIYVVPSVSGGTKINPSGWRKKGTSHLNRYGLAVLMVLLVTVAGMLLAPLTGYFSPGFFYLAGVIGLGFFISSRRVMIFAAILSSLTWNFLFIPPVMTFKIERLQDILMCVFFFIIALLTGSLTSRLQTREQEEREREEKANSLFLYSRAISSSADALSLLDRAVQEMSRIMDVNLVVIVRPHGGKKLKLHETTEGYPVNEKEWSVASWCFEHRQSAGRFTDTLPEATGFYLPMMAGQNCMGVLGVKPRKGERLTVRQKDLLESMASQLGIALEREHLRAEKARSNLVAESEKLYQALLDSVSHEFKTPLAVIEGGYEKLSATGEKTPEEEEEFREILVATRRLRHLVRNLLDVTRLESGSLKPKMDWCDWRDIVDSSLKNIGEAARKGHSISSDFPEDYPLIYADFSLLEQVIVNLLLNACLHTPSGTPVTIKGGVDEVTSTVWLAVHDYGPGIPSDHAEKIFERFSTTRSGGLGLGLSIVRGFMEAQKGSAALSPVETGTCFKLTLPLIKHGEVPKD